MVSTGFNANVLFSEPLLGLLFLMLLLVIIIYPFVKVCELSFDPWVRINSITFRALIPDEIFIRVITYNCHFHIFHTNIAKLLDRNHYVYLQWLLSVRLRKQAILLFVYHSL